MQVAGIDRGLDSERRFLDSGPRPGQLPKVLGLIAGSHPQQAGGFAQGLSGGQPGKARLLAVEDEGIAVDEVVTVVGPQAHLGRSVGDQQVHIAVAVAIGQANELDIGQLQGWIKAAAPVVPQSDGRAFANG